jgi:hypothetical protein
MSENNCRLKRSGATLRVQARPQKIAFGNCLPKIQRKGKTNKRNFISFAALLSANMLNLNAKAAGNPARPA